PLEVAAHAPARAQAPLAAVAWADVVAARNVEAHGAADELRPRADDIGIREVAARAVNLVGAVFELVVAHQAQVLADAQLRRRLLAGQQDVLQLDAGDVG